mgnify:CR=1 FL=1
MAGQEAGDVLLVNGLRKNSLGIRCLQSIKTGTLASYSHVALCLGSGDIVHSNMASGVHRVFIDDLLSECEPEWVAIRNPQLPDKSAMKIINMASFYQRQSYNKNLKGILSGIPPNESSFCSQLVARILDNIGINVGVIPGKALPVHFQKLHNISWNDVTKDHKDFVKLLSDNPDIKEDMKEEFNFLLSLAMESQQSLAQSIDTYHALNTFLKNHHELSSKIGIESEAFQKLPYNKIPLEFWNIKQPKASE